MKNKVYNPRQDSFYLLDIVSEFTDNGDDVLEVGVGSSYILDTISEEYDVRTFGTDVGEVEVKMCSAKGHNAFRCSTSQCFSKDNFDIIYFNLPYLGHRESEKELEKRSLSYSEDLLSEYLRNSYRCLEKSGYSIFLISDRTPVDVEDMIRNSELTVVDIRRKELFFETLEVYILRKLDRK